jgi:energy-coupling factor transporter transmembrane protein EcfT
VLFGVFALVAPLALAGRAGVACAVGARALIASLAALAMASTLAPFELGGALRALGVPSVLSGVIEVMLRQVSILEVEGRRIVLALQLRGATRSAVATHVPAALLMRSIERAEHVELAMRLRGYDVEHAAERARLRRSDAKLLMLSVLAVASVHVVGQTI